MQNPVTMVTMLFVQVYQLEMFVCAGEADALSDVDRP